MNSWRHVFKLDPNRTLSDRGLETICNSGTDAVIVGGTDGITYENSRRLIERIRAYPVECLQEISDEEAVVFGVDGYLIPVVLNAGSLRWVLEAQHRAIRKYGDWIPWEKVAAVGYVVLNAQSKVARLTESRTGADPADIKAYARLAENLFRIPAVYLEYSGTFGDETAVRAAREGVERSHLLYGGGITREEEARRMARWADTVVVGNLVYENVEAAAETVRWVKETVKEDQT
ncbi:putative glycerol-1-phosphate prenyltransferase [Melghirimyces profundicolus]|uniref:Putative glycerol-1-phosphate prenyltransferase n=2 Tax=Melghirimyces profundicolus TaxID=1242148 RepID=A0A2T6AYK9_9BACL|nr:putative glycerol-1-phosphate prenyltransferase [Melghirimyces profundicolus]